MICEFQKQHELDYTAKTAVVLKQVADRRKTMNEKNVRTVLDNTSDHIQEACDDNRCDDTEEEDDNEDEEHGGVPTCYSKNGRRGGHPRMVWVIL
jgi:hypothetical protein